MKSSNNTLIFDSLVYEISIGVIEDMNDDDDFS